MSLKAKLGLGLLITAIVSLLVFNIVKTTDFFKTDISTFVTVIMAITVTYYLAQRKNDERNTKELVFSTIDGIQEFVNDSKNIYFEEAPDHKMMLLALRRLNSKSELLCKYAKHYKYVSEAEQIKRFIKQYEDLYDLHGQDIPYLQKTSTDIARWLENIDSRCDTIRSKLYPPNV
jgi:hypothetical protein